MPSKKKGGKGKKKDGGPSTPLATATAERVERLYNRSSVEVATELEELFGKDYPPSKNYDQYYQSLSNKKAKEETTFYMKVFDSFNEGVALTSKATNTPGLSRWHLVMEKMMDAIDVVANNEAAQTSFLKTQGTDRRYLLCKACLTLAQCYGKCLNAPLHIAWAKVAVAADPTYFNAYNQLGMGYANAREWDKALEASEKAMELVRNTPNETTTSLPVRLQFLRTIVNGPDEKQCKKAMRDMILDGRGTPMRFWQEMVMARPTKTCAYCLWPGELKCSKCKIVYYCSRDCQMFDYKEHKLGCVAPATVDLSGEIPEPDYPREELCTDSEWDVFQQLKESMGETSMLVVTANNCHAKVVKRALMQGDSPNTLGTRVQEYPVHFAALRREPDNAVEIMRVLIRHGACPNVIRNDGKHLLAICRERAKWIDDDEPSMENQLFRLQHFRDLEQAERKESAQLVNLVSQAIQQHQLCRLCKARKQNKGDVAHLMTENMTDAFLARQSQIQFDKDQF